MAGLYIHVPFCAAVCSYCHFARTARHDAALREIQPRKKFSIRQYDRVPGKSALREFAADMLAPLLGAVGLTMPLITKSDGTKFGKTESGTIWLDPRRTSPYAFYQFWLNTADADVAKFLRYFTFLDRAAIEALDRASETEPEKRAALRSADAVADEFVAKVAERIPAVTVGNGADPESELAKVAGHKCRLEDAEVEG